MNWTLAEEERFLQINCNHRHTPSLSCHILTSLQDHSKLFDKLKRDVSSNNFALNSFSVLSNFVYLILYENKTLLHVEFDKQNSNSISGRIPQPEIHNCSIKRVMLKQNQTVDQPSRWLLTRKKENNDFDSDLPCRIQICEIDHTINGYVHRCILEKRWKQRIPWPYLIHQLIIISC